MGGSEEGGEEVGCDAGAFYAVNHAYCLTGTGSTRRGWLLLFGGNEAEAEPFKRLWRAAGVGVPFTPSNTEIVPGSLIVVLVLIAGLHLEIVACGKPLVDCRGEFGDRTSIDDV